MNNRRERRGRTEDRKKRKEEEKEKMLENWIPKTELGKKVKNGEIQSIEEIFNLSQKILEPEIVDLLVPELEEKLVDFTKTTKVRRAGRMFSFRAAVLVGDKKQFVGFGTAKDKERWPAIRKATRQAKLNLVKIRKGNGAWESATITGDSIPFKVTGKSSSSRVELIPAPEGTGLVCGDKIKDVMKFVGIKDIWSKSSGNTSSTLDFIKAAINALNKTTEMKMSNQIKEKIERRK
jgi:small subunit ribosomal protein S5